MYRLGAGAAAHPWRTLAVWALLAIAVVAGSAALGDAYNDSMSVPGSDSAQAMELLERAGSTQAGVTARVVATPLDSASTFSGDLLDGETPDSDAGTAAAELITLQTALSDLSHVEAVNVAIAPDQRVALLDVQYTTLDQLSVADLDSLKDLIDEQAATTGLRIEAGGELFWNYEEAGASSGELIGIVIAMLILLVAFGTVLAMGLPVGTAIFGLVVGISTIGVLSHVTTIPSAAPQMGSMIGLGVGIDYALLMVTRFREYPHHTRDEVIHAVGSTVATSGKAVLFAGGTVVIAICGLAVTGISFVTAMGVSTSVVVAVMVAASLTLLPALLGLLGTRIDRWSIGRRSSRAVRATEDRQLVGRWQRWGQHVTRHAVAYAIGTTVLLGAMAAPTLALRLGFPDEGTLAESRTERRAYDMVAESFGPGVNGPLLIAVDLGTDGTAQPAPMVADTVADTVAEAVDRDAGIAAVFPPQISAEAGVATIIAIPVSAPRDAATYDTIDRLRNDVFPAAIADVESVGDTTAVSAHVGGSTATFDDLASRVSDRLPWFIATVIGLSFILLMMLFRSVLVPVKAAVMNLLSIGAAYGVLVMVFQWGWGKSLFGLETTVPIMSFIPMFMFAVLFGLSMDYEVFLLSRVREFYDRTHDNEQSVIDGIATTARVITSAALIMISVFGGFVFGSDPTIKMLGLGMATAIFVDATIVRLVLVPATMKLMGDANWWLPEWANRRLPTIHLDD